MNNEPCLEINFDKKYNKLNTGPWLQCHLFVVAQTSHIVFISFLRAVRDETLEMKGTHTVTANQSIRPFFFYTECYSLALQNSYLTFFGI